MKPWALQCVEEIVGHSHDNPPIFGCLDNGVEVLYATKFSDGDRPPFVLQRRDNEGDS